MDGDADIAASSTHLATAMAHPADLGLPPASRKPVGGEPPPKRTKALTAPPGKVHNVSAGQYTTNRRGTKLCQAFQTGACSTAGRACIAGSHQFRMEFSFLYIERVKYQIIPTILHYIFYV